VPLPITILSVPSDFALLPKTTESPALPTPAKALASFPPTILPLSSNTTLVSANTFVVIPVKNTVPIIVVTLLLLSVLNDLAIDLLSSETATQH